MRLWCVMKNGFYMTTGDNQLSSWMKKKLQSTFQSQTCTQIRSCRCLVVCCPFDPLEHAESWRNHYIWEVCSANQWDALKTATPAASTDQQRGPESSPWQRPTAYHTTNQASKVEWIGLQSFASSSVFTWPLTNQPPLLQASWQLFAGKMLPQPEGGRKCFPRVYWIPKHGFLHHRKKLISSWQKCVDCNGSYFD